MGFPGQKELFVFTGVTIKVAVTGVVPVFTAIKAGIFPVSLAGSPMPGILLVQVYVVPARELLKT